MLDDEEHLVVACRLSVMGGHRNLGGQQAIEAADTPRT